MFFKKKCPNCGAKNDKERMTCAACGAPLVNKRIYTLCADLRAIGVDARMVERGRPEEQVGRHGGGEITMLLGLGGDKSLGLIQIQGSPICWVNILKEKEPSKGAGDIPSSRYRNLYLVPAPTIVRKLHLETIREKSVPVIGRVVNLRWQGNFEDFSEGLTIYGALYKQSLTRLRETIRRLNEDVSLNQSLLGLKVGMAIHSYPEYGYWAISSWQSPSRELWDCYEIIARHLLEPVESE